MKLFKPASASASLQANQRATHDVVCANSQTHSVQQRRDSERQQVREDSSGLGA